MVRKRKHSKKQSLPKNIALLFLSLGILAGASLLFSTINARPEYSYDPLETKLNKLVSKGPEKSAVEGEKEAPQKSSANSFEYSYWDILLLQDKSQSSSGESFSVQIASFKSLEAAKQYAAELEGKTHLRCLVDDNSRWYIVRWGNFHTREVAERYCGTLSSRLQKECVVVKL